VIVSDHVIGHVTAKGVRDHVMGHVIGSQGHVLVSQDHVQVGEAL
jgi:hypothetical protein